MFCTKCGASNDDQATFCTGCGAPLTTTAAATRLQNRNPIFVLIFSLITLGIYHIYWFVVTKNELNASGADIPTAWLIIIPIVSIWWEWKFCEGIDLVTRSKMSTVMAFLVLYLLGSIGSAIVQDSLNKVAIK